MGGWIVGKYHQLWMVGKKSRPSITGVARGGSGWSGTPPPEIQKKEDEKERRKKKGKKGKEREKK